LLVVCPAVVVMEVSLQGDPTLRLRIACIYRCLVVESVAVVPLCAVFRPRSHANPAELMFAFLTCHMVASAVLLNGTLTLCTFFGVSLDPVGSLTVVLAFL